MADNVFGFTIKPIPHDKDMMLRGVRETHLTLPAEKEFKFVNAMTGNLPLSFSVEQYYGEPWTPGGNDLMYAQKVRWLGNYEREDHRNRARYQADRAAASYKERYGSQIEEVRRKWLEDTHSREGLQQAEFIGLFPGGKGKRKDYQFKNVRNDFWKTVSKEFGSEAYYKQAFALYLYNAGCVIISEITAALMNSGRDVLDEAEKQKVFDALFRLLEEGKLLGQKDRGVAGVKDGKTIYKDIYSFENAASVAAIMRKDMEASKGIRAGESLYLLRPEGWLQDVLVDTDILDEIKTGPYQADRVDAWHTVVKNKDRIVYDPLRSRYSEYKKNAEDEYAKSVVKAYEEAGWFGR